MSSKVKTRYWDANCFIAVFNKEATTHPTFLSALETTFNDMLDGKVHIVTSTLFFTEVLPKPENKPLRELLASCPNFTMVETVSSVHALAGELRQKCRDAKQRLEPADAIHIAAGHLSRVDEIWTTDEKLVNKSKAGLLTETPVCFPHVDQLRMQFDDS